MRAYAAKAFELGAVDRNGVTKREILEGLLARTGDAARRAEREAELACPPFPYGLGRVWDAFCRLSARRGAGFSINPITWPDIDAFCRLSGQRLAPFEIRLLEDLDNLYRAEQAKPKTES